MQIRGCFRLSTRAGYITNQNPHFKPKSENVKVKTRQGTELFPNRPKNYFILWPIRKKWEKAPAKIVNVVNSALF